MSLASGDGFFRNFIEIGIAIEIENKCHTTGFDRDIDSDFDSGRDISETMKAYVNDIEVKR